MFYRQACNRGLASLLAFVVLSACGNSDSPPGASEALNPTGPLPIDDPLNVVIDVPDSTEPEPVVVVEPEQPVSNPSPEPNPEPEPSPAGPESGITSAQFAQLPDDCLLTQDAQGIAYCFSPATRNYTAVNLDGNVLYEFILPGDNATNSVKGLFIGPEDSIHDVCLVADITVAVSNSEFEMSCFQSSGAFVGTVPTLGTPPRYGDPIKMEEPQGVNVNNEPLLVAQAPQGRAYVAGTRYSLDVLADAGQLDAWQKQGSFIAIVEPIAGGVIATHLFTSENIVALEPSGNSLIVTFDSGESQTLDPNDLGPVSDSLPANRSTLAPENLAHSLPTLIAILEGTQFEQFNNTVLGYTDALVEQIDPAQRWPDTPLCPLSGPPGCEQTVVAAPLNVPCSISGRVTVTFSTERITAGSTRNTILRALWSFDDDCVQALDNDEQAATLRGEVETVEQTITAVPGNSNSRISEFFAFQFQPSNGQNTSVTGSWSNRDIQSSREGSLTTERLGNFSEILALNGSDIRNASIGRSVVTSQGSSQFSVGDPDSTTLGFSISNSSLGLDSMGLIVSTPLFTGFTQTLSGYRFSRTQGVIEMRANDGSSAMLTLSTDAPTDSTPSTNSAGQELVNYQMMHDGTET